jgi:hypothetical protein
MKEMSTKMAFERSIHIPYLTSFRRNSTWLQTWPQLPVSGVGVTRHPTAIMRAPRSSVLSVTALFSNALMPKFDPLLK